MFLILITYILTTALYAALFWLRFSNLRTSHGCCRSALVAVRVALYELFQQPFDSIADRLTRGFLGNETIQQSQVNVQRKIVVSDFDSSLDRCAQ